jgi:hypothetical protein
MTYYDVYIGRLDDPSFSWDGGNWNGNVPHRLSPFFPPYARPGLRVWDEFHRRLASGEFKGRQTDWGGWVAPASKAQIEAFMADLYFPRPSLENLKRLFPHVTDPLDELVAFVSDMDDDGQFALVATEL